MKNYVEIDGNQARILQSKYSCAFCWNPIRVKHDKDGDYTDCGTDDCRSKWFVSNYYVKKQIEERERKGRIARELLKDFLPKKQKQTEEDMMKSLGF